MPPTTPQAWVLRPDVVMDLATEIMQETTPYRRTRQAALATLKQMREANRFGELNLGTTELRWLERLSRQADELLEEEDELLAAVIPQIDPERVSLKECGL